MSEFNYKHSIGFLDLLLILFIGLKLGGVITWSWWWVFAPIWIPVCVILIGVIIFFVGLGIVKLFERIINGRN